MDRFQEVTQRFDEASALEGEAREAYLRGIEDASVRDELRLLLESDHSAGEFMLVQPDLGVQQFPVPDSQFGPFRVVRELGRGGAGAVFLAEDTESGGKVALKLLHPMLWTSEESRRELERESTLAGRLDHPAIVALRGLMEIGGWDVLAYEYVEGGSFAEEMHRFHRGEAGARWTDREDAAWDLLPVLEALSYAHESGIWHRDVKPSNILLREGLGGALADFGLAKDSMDGEVTHSGVFKGSVKYVSPEQARARMRLVDHRSDIFSCGLVLFEALSGEHAYAAQNEFQILEQIAVAEPRMLDEVWDDAPASLVAICYWALRPDREERYQSILEFANDLRAALEGKPVSVSLPDWNSHVARFVRRNRARLVGTLFIFAVLASAIAAYVIMSRPPTSPVNVVSTAEGHEVLVQEHNPASGRYGEAWMVGRTPVRVDLPEGQYRFTVIAPDGAFSEVAGVVHANDADAREHLIEANPVALEQVAGNMAPVAAGEFPAGLPFSLEYPTRDEVIERDYWIDRREVTNAQFAAFLDATGREPIASTFREIDLERYGDFPVVNVTWDEATAYAKWVGKRLPTAKEWERAARGTDGRSLPWGIGQSHADSVAARASIGRASLNDIAGGHDLLHLELGSPVGSHPFDVSPDGLFDVLGGVSEFVENRPLVFSGEELLVSDRERMYMGHSWKWKSESVHLALFGTLADSHRGFDDAVGFRCAKSSAPVAKAR